MTLQRWAKGGEGEEFFAQLPAMTRSRIQLQTFSYDSKRKSHSSGSAGSHTV